MIINDVCKYGIKSSIKASDANDGEYMFFTSSSDESKRYSEYQYDCEGIIMGTGGNATLHYYNGKFSTSTDCIVLLTNSNVKCKYLFYILKSKIDVLEAGFKGAGLKHTNKNYIGSIDIGNVPSIKKQDEIIKMFDNISNISNSLNKKISLLDELVKARFVEMFGDIKSNSKNWITKPLKELCVISRGGSPRPIVNYLGGTIPWIKIGDATDGDNIYINSTKEHIIEEGIRKSRYIKSGSLIFANCGVSLGFCRIINFDGCIHDGWLAFQNIDESLDKVFLLMTINQQTEYFRSIAPGGTQPNLNTEIMGNYQQIVPPLKLQKEYIEFVEQIDKSKFVIQKSIEASQELYDSLMQKYFG